MTDGYVTGECFQDRWCEDIVDQAHLPVPEDPRSLRSGDAGTFLASMLKRVQAQVGQVGRFRMAVYTEDAALFSKFIKSIHKHLNSLWSGFDLSSRLIVIKSNNAEGR
jgi:hypothetical protein